MAWTTPRTWVTGEVVTAAMMNEQVRDNEDYLKAHVDAATAVHGLGTGVYPTGCKQEQLRFEYKEANVTLSSGTEVQGVTLTWNNAFTTIRGVQVATYYTTADYNMGRNYAYVSARSATGATVQMAASGGKSDTFTVQALAYGV